MKKLIERVVGGFEFSILLVLLFTANLAFAGGVITAGFGNDVGPDPSQVYIQKIAYAGSGCKAGSVSDILDPDAKAFTLLFDSYIAEAGPGVAFSEGRKNCQIAIDMRFPSGWSFTVFDVDYRGYARMDRGASGLQKTNYFFNGGTGPALQSSFYGPVDRDYRIRDSLALSSVVWSPCGMTRALNLNTQIRVTASGSQRALLTIDSITGQLTHRYGIMWRQCR